MRSAASTASRISLIFVAPPFSCRLSKSSTYKAKLVAPATRSMRSLFALLISEFSDAMFFAQGTSAFMASAILSPKSLSVIPDVFAHVRMQISSSFVSIRPLIWCASRLHIKSAYICIQSDTAPYPRSEAFDSRSACSEASSSAEASTMSVWNLWFLRSILVRRTADFPAPLRATATVASLDVALANQSGFTSKLSNHFS